jgi:hypothetical protein
VIGAAVAMMPTDKSSSMGRRRSLLLRVGEVLGVLPVMVSLPPLAAASPEMPYSPSQVQQLRSWARSQRAHMRGSAQALLVLGLGAGLPTRDLARVRAVDVVDGGAVIRVSGSRARDVPIAGEWVDDAAEVAKSVPDSSASLFRPGAAWQKNLVTVFVARTIGDGIRPSTRRMRATWLVERLTEGMPMQELLSAAGLVSMRGLVRYEQFLPSPQAARAGTRR